jgi:phosphoglycolate phosphatase-like HAD superfamily hydrolase
MFAYNQDSVMIDYMRPVLHTLNKQHFIYKYGKNLKRNVIVIGDLIEDIQMARESSHNTILKIGFLNSLETEGHLLEEYQKNFDIVIVNNGSLKPVNFILDKLFLQ